MFLDAASNGEEMKDGIPFDAPEMEEFKEKRLEFEKEWPALSSSISSTCPIEPKVIGIDEGVSQEEIQDTAIKAIEGIFVSFYNACSVYSNCPKYFNK